MNLRAGTLLIGEFIDTNGSGSTKLIRQSKPIADRQFEIEFLDPGVAAYAFAFG